MTFTNNIIMALASIKSAKYRSLLTMLGVITAVASVIVVSSVGEGVKRQISQQSLESGVNNVTVLPGQIKSQDDVIGSIGYIVNQSSSAPLTDADFKAASSAKVSAIVPFARVTGVVKLRESTVKANIVGTTPKSFNVLGYKLEYGSTFDESQNSRKTAVIGRGIAQKLFNENVPIGKTLDIRGETFIVRGVLEDISAQNQVISGGLQHNDSVFIQYEVAQILMGGFAPIYQIVATPPDGVASSDLAKTLQAKIAKSRSGEIDFSVLTHDQLQKVISNNLTVVIMLVFIVAIIAILVGGIGIMNIMLVVVAERTKEIGVRKAIGASSWQILKQFIAEAMILSFIGSVLGVVVAVAIDLILRVLTSLQPVIEPSVVVYSVLIATVFGVIFGSGPALKAARKDPIEALRS